MDLAHTAVLELPAAAVEAGDRLLAVSQIRELQPLRIESVHTQKTFATVCLFGRAEGSGERRVVVAEVNALTRVEREEV